MRVVFCAFGFGVKPCHLGLINRSFERTQLSDALRIKIFPVEEYGLVLRKEARVVFEYDEIVFSNLCVSRISVLDVNRLLAERSISESVIDADNFTLW